MKTRILYLLIFLSFLSITEKLKAQENCGASVAHQRLMQSDTLYKKNYLEYEKNIHAIIQNQKLQQGNSGSKIKQVYIVPVVVHVLHLGEAIGTGTNISDAQIQGAISAMSNRFRGISGVGIDTEIEFCLASRDPNGCPTNGINRVNASAVPNYTVKGMSLLNTCGAAYEYVLKDLSKWTTYYYYNIWVVNLIDCSSLTTSGFASPPSGTPYDGTVILASAMNNSSTTLTHELGHGFGLLHTFEGDFGGVQCPANANCTVDGDQICDTPPHKKGDCGTTNPCSGSGNWDDSRYNYMSYCGQQDRFTTDQKARLRASFVGFPRALLLLSNGCLPSNFASVISKTDVSCYGACDGTASVTPTCPSTYSYLWSNGNSSNSLSGLCGGTYTLTITDANSNSASIPVTIAEPTAITASPTVNGKSCNGNNDGSISLNVSGGVPFTCGSNFTIGIGNGTVVSTNTQYPAPFGNYRWGAKHQIFFHQTELQAAGFSSGKIKSVALNVASLSGTGTYRNFEIQMKAIPNVGSLNAIQPGLQTVFGAQTINITTGWNTFYFTNPLQWNGLTSIILQFCFNDSVSTFNSPVYCSTTSFKSVVYVVKDSLGVCNLLPAIATSVFRRPNVRFGVCNDSLNYQYLWSNGAIGNSISGLDTGTYSVTINDANGCFTSSLSTLGQSFATADAGTDVFINLGNSAPIGGSPAATGYPPFSYTWSPSAGLNSATVANPLASPNVNTTYYLSVTDSNACTATDTVTVFVNTSIGITELTTRGALTVSSLPGNDYLLLKAANISNGNYVIQIFNALGKKCLENNFSITNQSLRKQISASFLTDGLYFISLANEKENVVLKFRKQE